MRSFFFKSAFFILVVILLQVFFYDPSEATFFEKALLDQYLSSHMDILFLNDSINRHYHESDPQKKPTIYFLQERLSEYNVFDISHPAYPMEVFREYIRYMIQRPKEQLPSAVIIPINFRSFGPQWDIFLGSQFEKEKAILRHDSSLFRIFAKPLFEFNAFRFKEFSKKEYDNTPVFNGEEQVGIVKDFDAFGKKGEGISIKDTFIFHYMYRLTPEHQKMVALKQSVDMLDKKGIKSLIYITPVDIEAGKKHLGNEFSKRIADNVKVIYSLLEGTHADILDFSETLGSEQFNWTHSPNEHLKEDGRRYVATRLAETIHHYISSDHWTLPSSRTADTHSDILKNDGDKGQARDLFELVMEPDMDNLESMIKSGANVNQQNSYGWTPLMWAALNGRTNAVTVLLESGARLDYVHPAGFDTLMLATYNNHYEIVDVLIHQGAPVNTPGFRGKTVLMLAADQGLSKMAELFIAAGARVDLRDDAKWDAMKIAFLNGHSKICQLIQDRVGASGI